MEIALVPRWLLKYISSDNDCQYELNILISNILILCIFILFKNKLFDVINYFPHFCLFDRITGIQCPACGITRSLCKLSEANIAEAYKLNLSSLFVALFFISQIPLRIFSICKPGIRKDIKNISKVFSWLVVVVIMINWLINLKVAYL